MSKLVFDSIKFLQWKERIEKSGVTIENIEVLLFPKFFSRCILIRTDWSFSLGMLTAPKRNDIGIPAS